MSSTPGCDIMPGRRYALLLLRRFTVSLSLRQGSNVRIALPTLANRKRAAQTLKCRTEVLGADYYLHRP